MTSTRMSAGLEPHASDPDWVVAPGGDGAPYVGQNTIARSTPLPSVYLPDNASAASRWIVINSGFGIEGFSLGGSHYNFQTNVDLTGFSPSTVSIPNGRFAVDDGIVDVKINGTTLNFPNGFAQGLDGEYPRAIELVSTGVIKVRPMITAVAPLGDGPKWFERLYAREPNLLKVVLAP